jgi:hypothetical protein
MCVDNDFGNSAIVGNNEYRPFSVAQEFKAAIHALAV